MRNRISYQNVALMVGPAPAYSAHTGAANHITDRANLLRTLNLVQSSNFNLATNRNEISQIGGTDSLTTRKISSPPEVSFSFSMTPFHTCTHKISIDNKINTDIKII